MTIRGGAIINIAGTTPVDDPEYRYRMPAVYGKIEGSGNGIKTAIPNISAVAASLHREPGEVNKFFGCELGAQTTYAEETDRAIVNGAHTDDTLQTMMHRYIEGFVLCTNCKLVSRGQGPVPPLSLCPFRGPVPCVLILFQLTTFLLSLSTPSSLTEISPKRTTRSRMAQFGRSVLLAGPRKWLI